MNGLIKHKMTIGYEKEIITFVTLKGEREPSKVKSIYQTVDVIKTMHKRLQSAK